MTKNRSAPAEVIGSCQKVLLIAGFWSPLRVYSFKTFAESSFYLLVLVFILHLACVLPSPQSAVCIFRSVRSLCNLHKGNWLKTQQTPRLVFSTDPVLSTDPGTPRPRVLHGPRRPGTAHPGPVLCTKQTANVTAKLCSRDILRLAVFHEKPDAKGL